MIRPVEYQGVVQRNQDIATINQNEHDRPYIDQPTSLSETKKEAESLVRDVKSKDKLEHRHEKHDAKEKGSNEYHGDGGKKRKQFTNTEGTVRSKEFRNFDVKI